MCMYMHAVFGSSFRYGRFICCFDFTLLSFLFFDNIVYKLGLIFWCVFFKYILLKKFSAIMFYHRILSMVPFTIQ